MMSNICQLDHIHCDECICDNIEDWKKQSLTQIEEFRDKLNNKIKELNCVTEIIMINHSDNNNSVIKQIEDILDTIFVDITHIDNFNKLMNDNNIPISHIIKRKNKILDNNIVINLDITSIDEVQKSETIDIIIKHGLDKALQHASENGYLDIVKIIIKYGANVQAYNNYAIRWASMKGHLEVIKCLIAHGAAEVLAPCEDKHRRRGSWRCRYSY
jgi:ankyrin repeat protein